MKFSICIITENCYESGLQNILSFFLNETLIDDIIIFDKSGSDIIKISNNKSIENEYKLNLILGCKNIDDLSIKIKCGKLSKNQWVVFYDSFAVPDNTFFNNVKNYILKNIANQEHVALAPCYAKGGQIGYGFYHYLAGSIITRDNFNKIVDKQTDANTNNSVFNLLTTGTFIYHRSTLNNIDLSKDKHLFSESIHYNTLLLKTLMFEQLNSFELHVVPGMEYNNQLSIKREEAIKNKHKKEIIYDLESRIWNCCQKNTNDSCFSSMDIINKTYINYCPQISVPNKKAIVYCFGSGKNITHELKLAKMLDCCIHLFDPSPESIKHYLRIKSLFHHLDIQNNDIYTEIVPSSESSKKLLKNKITSYQFHPHPIALSTQDNNYCKFFKTSKEEENYSLLTPFEKSESILVKSKKIKTIMKELDHQKIDVLKLDVVGMEIEILNQMIIEDKIYPTFISVQFYNMNDKKETNNDTELSKKISTCINMLMDNGYNLCSGERKQNFFDIPYTFLYDSK